MKRQVYEATAARGRGEKNRLVLSSARPCLFLRPARNESGFTLLELVITLIVLAILTLGAIALVQISVKRQREQELREALREMRSAIEQFHRDTIGCPGLGGTGATQQQQATQPQQPGQQQQPQLPIVDPRSRVCISDATIFTADNPDRYPPDLETLVNGVNVTVRAGALNLMGGGGLSSGGPNATEQGTLALKKKVYLRKIPVDPMTGEADWELRSLYDSPDTSSWGGENVFDVRSKSKGTALNGEKYSDW